MYTLTAIVEDSRIGNVETALRVAFGEKIFSIQKIKKAESRADRLSDAEASVEHAKSVVDELREELQSWVDNLPENLQGGDKASRIEDAISSLTEIFDGLDQCDWGVDFPGMY